jgi:hypothetical protein
MLYTRSQEQGKTRNVWGFPIADTMQEMFIFLPLLAHQKKLSWRAALIGPDAVDAEVTRIFNHAISNNQILLSADFSAYDSTVKQPLQDIAFQYIRRLFQKFDGPLNGDLLSRIAKRFASIAIITPDGILEGLHGVPSGSTLTNEIDSIVQYLVAIEDDANLVGTIQGDDGLYSVSNPDLKYEQFQKYGLDLNSKKSAEASNYCLFLQNYYSQSYSSGNMLVRVRPLYRALNQLVHLERWTDFDEFSIKGVDYFSLRAIQILENCKNHPYFIPFVKWVAQGDKYKLKFSNEGLTKYSRYIRDSKGAGDFMYNQYGDDLKGLNRFKTVQVLKSEIW